MITLTFIVWMTQRTLVPQAFGYYNIGAFWRAPTQLASGTFGFVQESSKSNSAITSLSAVYYGDQFAGDTNIVIVQIGSSSVTVKSLPTGVSDTAGNTYVLAVGPTQGSNMGQYIFYAKNIVAVAGGTNTVTVQTNSSTGFNIDILEYSGLDKTNPLDVAAGVTGASTSIDSGNITTTNANDFILGAANLMGSVVSYGSNQIMSDIAATNDIIEGQVVTSTGTYSATGTEDTAGYVAQIVAFKRAGTPPAIQLMQINSGMNFVANAVAQYYHSAQTPGNTNIVVVAADSNSVNVSQVTDSSGNSYSLAVGPTRNNTGGISQWIYYAKNITAAAGNANTVTATFDTNVDSRVQMFEYSGLSTTAPFDVSSGAFGSTGTTNSGNVTTNFANELIFGSIATDAGLIAGGSGFRFINTDAGLWSSGGGTVNEDKLVTSTGTYSVSTTVFPGHSWVAQVATFH